ncbi:MAG: leucine-rich repeat domain-containing protein [Clostridia bacterium]|nr:leucine-rich repeat domain-containing protein [Clostridia bacterium]
MKDVFISYKNEEFDEANWVKTTLETNGISCWMAPMCIPGGSSYAVEIPVAIRNCKVFVLILSKRSQDSKWVPRELDQAINAGKTVLPFMLEDCPLKDDFNFYLTNVQRYAAYESKTKAIEKMLNEIKAILAASNPTVDSEVVKAVPNEVSEVKAEIKEAVDINIACKEAVSDKTKPAVEKVEVIKVDEKKPAVEKVEVKKAEVKKTTITADEKKKAKKRLIAVCCFALALVLAIVGIVIYKESNSTVIAGKKFYNDVSTVTLDGKTLSKNDVEAFRNFEDLSSVYLNNCVLPDNISVLISAPKYTVALENCGVTDAHLNAVDFESLSLSHLILNGNKNLSDIGAIAPLNDTLDELMIDGCSVKDISVLKNFERLARFSADGNGLADVSALGECKELTSLNLANNQVTTLEAFASHKLLKSVDVRGNRLADLTGLESSISLKSVLAADNDITSIDGLKNTTLLETVDLGNNAVTDISVLSASCEHLRSVVLSGNGIKDISALSGCAVLSELRADENGFSDISVLSSMPELKSLSLADNNIVDITPISNCQRLIHIDLSGNAIERVVSLPAFSEAQYGVTLDISDNQITELKLPNVKYNELLLYGNKLTDISTVNALSGSTIVFDYNEGIDFAALGNSEFYDYKIFDCPLDKQISVGEALGAYKTTFTTLVEYLAAQEN